MADDKNMLESEDEADEQETALLPRSWFQGKDIEIGKKCELKVEGVFEDEIEVSYVPHKKSKDGKDKDSDDDDDSDDKPKKRRHDRHWRDGDMMDHTMAQMDGMGAPPAPGGY